MSDLSFGEICRKAEEMSLSDLLYLIFYLTSKILTQYYLSKNEFKRLSQIKALIEKHENYSIDNVPGEIKTQIEIFPVSPVFVQVLVLIVTNTQKNPATVEELLARNKSRAFLQELRNFYP